MDTSKINESIFNLIISLEISVISHQMRALELGSNINLNITTQHDPR